MSDNWIPASNGTETVFTSRSGVRLLYCWQPSTGKHAYLNVDTDIILSDAEAAALLQTGAELVSPCCGKEIDERGFCNQCRSHA